MRSADGLCERRMGERGATDQFRNKVAARRLAVRKNGDGFEVVGAGELVDVGWQVRANIRRGGGIGLRG